MWRAVLALVVLTVPVQAEAPTAQQRPQPRPQIAAAPPAAPVFQTPVLQTPVVRPLPRPVIVAAPAQPLTATAQPDASIRPLASVPPQPRPAGFAARVAGLQLAEPQAQAPVAAEPVIAAKPERRKRGQRSDAKTSRKGSVCGVPAIKGEEIARITSKVKGCGIEEPVRVTSVSGVRLSQAATIDCDTAQALNRWVESGLQPSFGRTKVVELRVAAHYICRSRNNIKGAQISEHGRGKAIDIAAVVLENGKTVNVLGGFGKELRRAHKAACGIFGTTLGPGSDGFHEDHMHFDTASHRSGPYCR